MMSEYPTIGLKSTEQWETVKGHEGHTLRVVEGGTDPDTGDVALVSIDCMTCRQKPLIVLFNPNVHGQMMAWKENENER